MVLYNTLQKKYDIAVGKVFSTFLLLYSFNVFFQTIVEKNFFSKYSTYMIAIGFAIVLLKYFNILKGAFGRIVIDELLLLLLLILALLRYNGYGNDILKRCIWTFVFGVPMYELFKKVNEIKVVLKKTEKAVFLITLLMLGMIVIMGNQKSEYNMTLGYALLYPTLFLLSNIKNNEKKYTMPLLLDIILIVFYGSRGPLLCIGVFLVFYIIQIEKSIPKRVMISITSLCILVIVIFFHNEILIILGDFCERIGISARTIRILLEGKMLGDSGRGLLYKETWSFIKEKPILGWGIAGDIVCMEMYPHFIFLEILLDFGIFLGAIISGIIVLKIIRSLIKCKNEKKEYILLLCCGFVPLLVSHSYLQAPLFWILLGASSRKEY